MEDKKNVGIEKTSDDSLVNPNILENFDIEDEEIMDLTTEKLKELNKKLPSWSLEPPHTFLK